MLICFKSDCIPTPARALQRREEEKKKRILISIRKKHALRVWSKRSKGMEQTLKEHQPDNTDINGIIYGSESSSDWRQEDNEKTGFVGCAYIFYISFTFSRKNFGILKFIIIFATKLDKSKMQLSLGLNGNI